MKFVRTFRMDNLGQMWQELEHMVIIGAFNRFHMSSSVTILDKQGINESVIKCFSHKWAEYSYNGLV